MFGFLRRGREEIRQLREQVAELKAAQSVSHSGAAATLRRGGGGDFSFAQPASLAGAREQLAHFDGWQYVAIKAIATRIAGAECYVARQPGGVGTKGAGNDLEPLPSHPLLDCIDDPNESMVRFSLLFSTVACLELTGLSYWWLADRGDRFEIWPLPTHWVKPVDAATDTPRWHVTPPGNPNGFYVDGDDIARFALPDPSDPFGATSPLQTQSKAINADEAIQTSQYAAFKNGIFPTHAVVVGKHAAHDGGGYTTMGGGSGQRPVLTPEQRQDIIDAVKGAYGNVLRYGEPAIFDGLIEDIKRLSSTPNEMDFLDSGGATKSRIMQGFNVHDFIVGALAPSSYAQAAAAERVFVENVINPLLMLLAQTITAWVCPRFARGGERLKFWFTPAIVRNEQLESQNWNVAANKGMVLINEYRRRILNLPDVDWGNVPPDVSGAALPALPDADAEAKDYSPYTLERLLSRNGRH